MMGSTACTTPRSDFAAASCRLHACQREGIVVFIIVDAPLWQSNIFGTRSPLSSTIPPQRHVARAASSTGWWGDAREATGLDANAAMPMKCCEEQMPRA